MKLINATLRVALLAVCLFVATSFVAVNAATLLKSGDRVVFFGDSITQQQIYTRYIRQYFYCRYPELKVKFFNAGWSGDTTGGALGRLNRDVFVLNPTVVTLFFGMNDGGYQPYNDDIGNRYRSNLEWIIKALVAKNVRVIVYTPGCVDPDKQPDRLGKTNYNDNLGALGKIAIELAQKYNLPYADVHTAMLDYQTAQKAKSASFSMSQDGVHPDDTGHYVMANTMIRAFSPDPMPALATIDLKTKQATGATIVSSTTSGATIKVQPTSVPYWVYGPYAATVQQCGYSDLVGQKLIVRGLDAGNYQVGIGSTTINATADQLAAGVNVLGTYSAAGQQVHDLARLGESWYYSIWRDYRLTYGSTPAGQSVVTNMLAAVEGVESTIYAIDPSKDATTITVTSRPAGANLALNAKYDCSDPNGYNWGIGGLTDGSWEASSAHCFASGDKDAFPKTVTIDLQQASKIGSVILGTPIFGATKTIQVSVSADGTTFTPVGEHLFIQKTEDKFTYSFAATSARYVRLTYPDHYDDGNGYPATFVFTEEAEVYPAK